jgi:hypothetical protein
LGLILWLPNGTGELVGGHFCIPGLGLRLLPLSFTLVLIASSALGHGSIGPCRPSGSDATRVGMSAFLRTGDVNALTRLAHTAGGADKLEDLQASWEAKLHKAQNQQDKEQVRLAIRHARDDLQASNLTANTPPAINTAWKKPNPAKGLTRSNFWGWAKY